MSDGGTGQTMTAAEYLAWEREQLDKHEFHDGEVIERPSCSPRHCLLAAVIMIELDRATHGHGCITLSSNMRIGAPAQQHYVYPAAVVVCGHPQTEPNTNDVLVNPAAVAEVLSPNNEVYVRGMKWQAYQRIPSLTDCLLVSDRRPRIEHYLRDAGSWRYFVYQAGDTITLANGAQLAVDAIYEGAFEAEAG